MDDMKVKFNRSCGKACGNNIDIVDVVYRAILEKDKFESKFMNITDEPAIDLIYAGIVATYNPNVNEHLEDFNYKTTKELLNVIRSFIHGKTIDINKINNILEIYYRSKQICKIEKEFLSELCNKWYNLCC
jgi:hypothetical protein